MSTRCASDTMSGHLSSSLGRESYKGCRNDGDVSMAFSRFVEPVDVHCLFCSTDSDKMLSNSKADSVAHVKFELSLSGSDDCYAISSSVSAAVTEKIVLVWYVFLLLPVQLPHVFFSVLLLQFCSVLFYSTFHLSKSNLATNFYKPHTF